MSNYQTKYKMMLPSLKKFRYEPKNVNRNLFEHNRAIALFLFNDKIEKWTIDLSIN